MYALKQKPQSGFTIVELLIVIVVIGILAAITIVAFNGVQQKAKIAVIQSDLSQASKTLSSYKVGTSTNDSYPADLATAKLSSNSGTTYQYTYTSPTNSYCLTGTLSGLIYMITSANTTPTAGACSGHIADGGSGSGPTLPAGYETAPVASGAQTSTFDGYKPVQPATCPTTGGSWVKVPGNSLYGTDNGFCVQQYPARNVSGVATSSATGARWTAITQPVVKMSAETAATGSHLFSENEWMTMATNAAAQPQNWSGAAVGIGSLPTGSATAAYAGASIILSNGERIYFDTSQNTGYAGNEFTCYTGPSANNCGLAASSLPTPRNAFYTDQFTLFTSYGALTTNSAGRYYGDPRYATPALNAYINSSRNTGLGYMYSGYVAGDATVYAFIRGRWTAANSSGLFTLYNDAKQDFAHAAYGFRAAK